MEQHKNTPKKATEFSSVQFSSIQGTKQLKTLKLQNQV